MFEVLLCIDTVHFSDTFSFDPQLEEHQGTFHSNMLNTALYSK